MDLASPFSDIGIENVKNPVHKTLLRHVLLTLLLFYIICQAVSAQNLEQELNTPNPRTAFLKSLAVPGWGHYYVDKNDWNRGKYHLGADVLIALSFFGLNIHSNNLQQNWYSYTRDEAGIDIENRSRRIQLAVGDFNNLSAYNDYQLRTRNWDQLLEDRPENKWNWQNDEERNRYNDIRNRFENIDQQLPALIGLMVVNRVISAISAYNRAVKHNRNSDTALYFSRFSTGSGIMANLNVRF